MRPEGVAAAQRELKRLQRANYRLQDAWGDDLPEADEAWVEFLTHAAKIYTKLRAACFCHPLDWSWWKKRMDERRDDPMLSYIHHARNCDTHRLEGLTELIPAGNGNAAHLKALPVMDKGVIYHPPPDHEHVIEIMLLSAGKIQRLVAEANSRLR
jgi:hypothetical protein